MGSGEDGETADSKVRGLAGLEDEDIFATSAGRALDRVPLAGIGLLELAALLSTGEDDGAFKSTLSIEGGLSVDADGGNAGGSEVDLNSVTVDTAMNGLDAALVLPGVPSPEGFGKNGPGLEMITSAFSSHPNRSEGDVLSGVGGSEGHFCIPY